MTTTEQMYFHLGIDLGVSADKVARLREKLGTKAKQEKNFRFYSLYGHICNMNVLKEAWKRVKKNDGSPGIDGISIDSLVNEPGIDGVTIESFDNEGKVMKFLVEIQTELQNKTYKPLPVKRVYIPKTNGKLRPLGIPTVVPYYTLFKMV
jgi:RNA-directed DNA polymerase